VAAEPGQTATLNVGPETGTYPGTVSCFQQRRAYAYSLNNPDTYWLSQTGAYTNFDAASVPIDSDAITGTPWGLQVNGVQWLQPMPGGLLIATGEDVWQLSGNAGAGSQVTPSSQSAQAQESNGFSPTVHPIKINADILYVSSLGYTIYDMRYNFYNNIYSASDTSVLSAIGSSAIKLLIGHGRCSLTRSSGLRARMASFFPAHICQKQEIISWARHDIEWIGCRERGSS
jgi:hypothetical protein